MSDNLPATISEEDYASIEAAVMETARGRWFLNEYARRNRNADTEMVLEAVARLENSLSAQGSPGAAVDIRLDLIDMAEAISRTREEIRSLSSQEDSDRFGDATEELDAVVAATEKATDEILAAAEKIQEAAYVAMERGEAKEECARIDELIIDIYTGCSFQDITGQRIQKVVQALRYVESRVTAMIEIWNLQKSEGGKTRSASSDARPDAHLLNGPARPGAEMEQSDVDSLMATTPAIVDPEDMLLDWHEDAVPAISMATETPLPKAAAPPAVDDATDSDGLADCTQADVFASIDDEPRARCAQIFQPDGIELIDDVNEMLVAVDVEDLPDEPLNSETEPNSDTSKPSQTPAAAGSIAGLDEDLFESDESREEDLTPEQSLAMCS